MNTIEVQAGDVVVTQFGVYQHWSLVSDRLCSLGKNMLISATKRTGSVQEETWDKVTEGKRTYVTVTNSEKPISLILSDARTQIGMWVYSITQNNCEHFVKWSSGLKVASSQVKAGIGGALVGGIAVAIFAEKNKTIKILGGAVIIAGIAIFTSKAEENKSKTSANLINKTVIQ